MKTKLHSISDQIDIWSLRLTGLQARTADCLSWLSDPERARSENLFRPEDRIRAVLSRGMLRLILADYMGDDPSRLVFESNKNGKPFLRDGAIDFNISHSRDRLLIAATAGRPVGVDIEMRNDNTTTEMIAKRFYSPAECAFFKEAENPTHGFFDIWAKKEAYVKARGTGIFQGLNSFSVPCGAPPGMPVTGSDPQWFFQALDIDPAYSAAVVSVAPPVPVRVRRYEDL